MIFVTTGTHYLPFNRLLIMVDKLIGELRIDEEIIIQSGNSKVFVEKAKIVPFLSYQETIKYISKARLVITAAGPATIFQVLSFGRNLPIVVPRLKKYGEHIGDHQLYFAKYLLKRSLCKLVVSHKDLINFYKNEEPINSKLVLSPSKELIKKLDDYLS